MKKREGYVDVLVAQWVRQGRVGRSRNGGRSTARQWRLYLECGHTVRRSGPKACKTVKCERCRVGFTKDWDKLPKKEYGVEIIKKVKK